jgi:hypothetical protein
VLGPGRHCHSTLSLTAIGCHCLGIYKIILLSLLSFSVKSRVAPGQRVHRGSPSGAENSQGWTILWASFENLAGIFSQMAGPTCEFWADPKNLAFQPRGPRSGGYRVRTAGVLNYLNYLKFLNYPWARNQDSAWVGGAQVSVHGQVLGLGA